MLEDTPTPDGCCSEPREESAGRCPVSKGVGQPVKWITMVALSRVPIPPSQEVFLCRDPDCEVVYFGNQGLELRRTDVHTVPGFKEATGGLVCYCFQHTQMAVEEEARTLRASPTLKFVLTKVQEKSCACEIRNPSGKCCLKDIQIIVRANTPKKGAV